MTYMLNYQRSDFFVTFAFNPVWEEIKQDLFNFFRNGYLNLEKEKLPILALRLVALKSNLTID